MKVTAKKTPDPDAQDGLDQNGLKHILGHQLAMAEVPTRKAFFKHVGKPFDLRPAEFSMLVLIDHNTDVTQKQLSQALATPAPNITTMLDRLSERGLLVRKRNQTDRRSIHIQLTAEGKILKDRVYEISINMEQTPMRRLSLAERAMLLELLQKIAP